MSDPEKEAEELLHELSPLIMCYGARLCEYPHPEYGHEPHCPKNKYVTAIKSVAAALRKRDEEIDRLQNDIKQIIAPIEVGGGIVANLESQLAAAEQKIKELIGERCMCGLDPMATIHQLRSEIELLKAQLKESDHD